MKNSCVEWYQNCMDSLFGKETDSWLYRILEELSVVSKLEYSEEIIKDTRFRYRALMDTSLDVFTGDRMENKSYQLPFAMYFVAKTMFKGSVVAIASEALMTIGNWDYRVRSNLLRFILFDDNPADSFLEKMTIFFMSLEECRRLEDVYMADCKDVSFSEYYPELLKEMANVDYEQILRILTRIRNAPERYYRIYDNVLWKVCARRVPNEMQQIYTKQEKNKSKYSAIGMESDLEDFVKKDMYDYIDKGYAASYNPFWLFGSSRYKDNIDFIFQKKHVVEFNVVWIQYLFLKAKSEGKKAEYINLLPDESVQRMEVRNESF